MSRARRRWDWPWSRSLIRAPDLDGLEDIEGATEEVYEYVLLTMDERSWQQVEGQWQAARAAERTPKQGAVDPLMVIWTEALRKSQEREARYQDQVGAEHGRQ